MNIALLTPVFSPDVGGMERFAEDLAGWLTRNGHEVTVVTKTPSADTPSVSSYEVVRITAWAEATQVIRRADVVHINGLSIRASMAAARSGKRPVVTHAAHQAICPTGIASGPGGDCTATGSSPGPCAACFRHGPSPWLNVRVQRLAARRAATNVCISDYLQRRLRVARSTTIYNPVGADAFEEASPPRETDLLVFVGRLAQEKGASLLLHALVDVPDMRLLLVGDGPQRAELERLSGELRIEHRVEFRGTLGRAAVLDAFRRSTLACVPTTCEEAFGYTAAEAMSVGAAVVSTPSGALPELLADERGYVAATMAAADLAATIRTALSDPGESRRRAERAMRFARENFHIDVTGQAYLDLYRRVGR